MGQWGIPNFDLQTSFIIGAGQLTLNFPDNSRKAYKVVDTQQLALLVDVTKDINNIEMLVEYHNEQLPGSDQFFSKISIDGSGVVSQDIFTFDSSGKFEIPLAVLRTTKFIKVSVRNAVAPDNGLINIFYIDEA